MTIIITTAATHLMSEKVRGLLEKEGKNEGIQYT